MRLGVHIAVLAIAVLLGFACAKHTAVKVTANYTGEPANDVFEAMKVGDVNAVASIIEKDASVLQAQDPHGRTLLHVAVLLDNANLVNLLLDKGMDPNIPDSAGSSPLAVLQESGSRTTNAKNALIKRGGRN
jgi:hypothetical protein